jgi:hypothetical protein
MSASLYQFLADDHDRLDALLERSIATPGLVDVAAYSPFREGYFDIFPSREKLSSRPWRDGREAKSQL